MTLTAVAVRVDITPSTGFPMGGYAARSDLAVGSHRPLEANVAALFSSGNTVVWVALDALAVTETMRDAVKESVATTLGVDRDEVLVVASHTHAAPSVWHGTIHPVLPASVDERECHRVAQLLGDALQGAAPVEVSVRSGSTIVEGVSSNRHRLDGPVDRSLHALEVLSDSVTMAVVFDFACHPTVQGADNFEYSPDWVGGARAAVRSGYDAVDLPVVYLPGAGGDTSTRFHRESGSGEEADRLGGIVGAGVLRAVDEGLSESGAMEIRVSTRLVTAARRTDFTDIGSQGMDLSNDRVKESLKEGAASREAFENADLPESYTFPVTTVRLGSTCWIHSPFEIAASLGAQVSRRRDAMRVIGYTDGYNGYLADAESSRNAGYEASASFFSQGETQRIIETLAARATECCSTTDRP